MQDTETAKKIAAQQRTTLFREVGLEAATALVQILKDHSAELNAAMKKGAMPRADGNSVITTEGTKAYRALLAYYAAQVPGVSAEQALLFASIITAESVLHMDSDSPRR